MRRAPIRVISFVAVCAALAGACESDYDDLSDDLLQSGWGEDAGSRLPTCMQPAMDAATGTDSGGSQDSGTTDAGGGSDSGSNGDGAAPDAGGSPDSGTPDAGSPDAS